MYQIPRPSGEYKNEIQEFCTVLVGVPRANRRLVRVINQHDNNPGDKDKEPDREGRPIFSFESGFHELYEPRDI